MIELARTVTFGQYIASDSAINRLDPRLKILCLVVFLVVTSFITTFSGYVILLFGSIFILSQSGVPTGYVLRGMRGLFAFLLFIYVITVIFYTSPSAGHSTIWQWGIFEVSWEGIHFATMTSIRVLFLYFFVSLLMFTTSLVDLTDGTEILLSPLQKLRVPVNELVMVLVIAVKFVPIFIAEVERLIKAQVARGANFDRGNPLERARRLGSILVPLFISAFSRAETLTMAMEARCYNGGRERTKRRVLAWSRADALAAIMVLLISSAALGVQWVSGV